MKSRNIGIIDGFLFLVTWSVTGMILASAWWGALPIIVFVLVPLAALVSWRTATLHETIIHDTATIRLYALDGAKWGFIASLAFAVWNISSQVFAAGNALDGSNIFSKEAVIYILSFYVPVCISGTFLGAAHGVVFFYINRWLAAANKVM